MSVKSSMCLFHLAGIAMLQFYDPHLWFNSVYFDLRANAAGGMHLTCFYYRLWEEVTLSHFEKSMIST